MPVMRVNRNKNYTTMSNTHLRDKNLSLKAKGLLSTILSLPDDWNYSISGIVSICKENESSVKSGLNELKEAGYMVIEKLYSDESGTGKFKYVYNIFENPEDSEKLRKHIKEKETERAARGENPQVENPPLENPPLENPQVENDPLYKYIEELNTKELNTDELNKDKLSTENINAHNSKELGRSIHASRGVTRSEGHIPYINPDNCTQQEFHDFILAKSMVFCKKHQGNEEAANELAKIIEYFYEQYEKEMGEKHPILSDRAFENVVIRYLYPPELLESNDIYGFGHYKDMIDKYFKTDYGRHHMKKYGTEIYLELSLSHFMSDEIRTNLAKKAFQIPY